MSDEKQKEKEWAAEIISRNTEGLKQLAEEKPAEQMRQNILYRKLRKIYRKLSSRDDEEKISTIDL